MIRFRKVMPSMRGISTSKVTTSGLSAVMYCLASKGSDALPTTSMSGCLHRMPSRMVWITGESSTMRTRILFMNFFLFP